MFQFIDQFYLALKDLPRRQKNFSLFLLDTLLIPICLCLAYALRLDSLDPIVEQDGFWLLVFLETSVGVLILSIVKQHRVKLRNFEINSIFQIGITTILLFLSLVVLLYLFRFWAPRSVPIIFSILFFVTSSGVRVFISILLNYAERRFNKAVPVAIYGTGNTAIQALSALKASGQYDVICFFDESSALHGATVANVKVESAAKLAKVVLKRGIQEIFIALPDAREEDVKTVANRISEIGLKCHVTPTFTQLLLNHSRDVLQKGISEEDLLGREKLDLLSSDLASAYRQKVVLVTGAGGSIGSEISRQLIRFKPKKLVLFENSELALYSISEELAPLAREAGTELVPKLGSVLDDDCLELVLASENVQALFHTAAYKHVPLVEKNIIEAAQNNILGTHIAASAAGKHSLERFVLISTDKAVRPTNVMGGTKRLAEIITKSCQEQFPSTTYSIVRFGNVLGSSGSVIPIFKKQIAQGGPVTVTHPEIIRYFMTIPEASKLVLIAGCFSDGGDTFVLDMGKPVKIVDMAQKIIELSGYTVKNDANPDGDISIDFVGLRPGEKMFEELIFSENEKIQTPHDKIFRVREKTITKENAEILLGTIKQGIRTRDQKLILQIIEENVEGFQRNSNGTSE